MDSTDLHRAVARYRVLISRWSHKGRKRQVVATDKTFSEAQQICDQTSERLKSAEPELDGRMCRSVAIIEMSNSEEVDRIMGYGPNFSYERAAAAVAEHLRQREAAGVPGAVSS